MDVLLVNSPLFERPSQPSYYADPPPLGLGYIASALRQRGYEVDLLDAVAEGLSTDQVLDVIRRINPPYVGTNIFSTNLRLVNRLITSPLQSKIFVGGPAVHSLSESILEWKTDNYLTVIVGEGEHVLPAILDGRVRPLLWRNQENRSYITVQPGGPWFPGNIDLPLDRTLFRHEPIYEERWGVYESHVITSRGCGHDCAFCCAARSVNPGQKIRFRSEADVTREIDALSERFPVVTSIRILDDLFLRNPFVAAQAARLFGSRGLHWRAMAHVAGLSRADKSLYRDLAASGCLELFVGIESGSPAKRAAVGKTFSLDATMKVITGLLDEGIHVKAYFILGFPDETEAEMRETFEFAARIAEYASRASGQFKVSAFKFRPYHGTRLYNELVRRGRLPSPIGEDHELAVHAGRESYGFTSDNFSAVPTGRLNNLIIDLQGINK